MSESASKAATAMGRRVIPESDSNEMSRGKRKGYRKSRYQRRADFFVAVFSALTAAGPTNSVSTGCGSAGEGRESVVLVGGADFFATAGGRAAGAAFMLMETALRSVSVAA